MLDFHSQPQMNNSSKWNANRQRAGSSPTIFHPVEKLIPLCTTSQSGPDQPPLYFRPTYALPDQGPLIADPSIFPERERAGVGRLSGVNEPLQLPNPVQRSNPALPDIPPSFRLTNPRSARLTPDIFLIQLRSIKDPPPICMLDFHSQPQMNYSSKLNTNRQSYEGSVPEMRIHGPYCQLNPI